MNNMSSSEQRSNYRSNKTIKVCVLLLLLIPLLLLLSYNKPPEVTKVLSLSNVPQKILDELRAMPLEPGYYFFEASFAGEAFY